MALVVHAQEHPSADLHCHFCNGRGFALGFVHRTCVCSNEEDLLCLARFLWTLLVAIGVWLLC